MIERLIQGKFLLINIGSIVKTGMKENLLMVTFFTGIPTHDEEAPGDVQHPHHSNGPGGPNHTKATGGSCGGDRQHNCLQLQSLGFKGNAQYSVIVF